jgi:hypothetical protein
MLTIRKEMLDALTEATLHTRIAGFLRTEFPDHVGHMTEDVLRAWIAEQDRRAMSLGFATATARSELILLTLICGQRATELPAVTAGCSGSAPPQDDFLQQALDCALLRDTGEP